MRISWKWLSEMVDLSGVGGPQGLADLLTSRGLEVEAIERQDAGLENVVTALIAHREPHPQSDRLSLCKVDCGGAELLQIVCGATNARAGIKVILAQVGANLPNGMKIGVGKIRGVESFGMLCSLEELKVAETAEGIFELPADTVVGRPIAEVLGRDDVIFVLKLTANRGDCMSHLGLAREVGAAIGKTVCRPLGAELKWSSSAIEKAFEVKLSAGENAPQFAACLLEGVKIGPSPVEWVKRLESLGSRTINNVVDATNLVMLELGHPVHAYDASQIQGGKIGVRMARANESLLLLDGATIELGGSEIVIEDGQATVGLAGVMGGGRTQVQDSTTRLLLEVAEFHPGLVRKAASRHLRRTDASQRFEKGVDSLAVQWVMSRLVTLIRQVAGGEVRECTHVSLPGYLESRKSMPAVSFASDYLKRFLGIPDTLLSVEKIESILKALDCEVARTSSGDWEIRSPSYRRDLRNREDYAEEVARTLGYDQIPATLPTLSSDPTFGSSSRKRLALLDRSKDSMVSLGLQESLNFAFTSSKWLRQLGLESALQVTNPLSEEHEALVPSLLPGLMKNALDQQHHHFGSDPLSIRLFEIRPIFLSKSGSETGSEERWKLAFALSGPRMASGLKSDLGEVDFYDVKAIVERLIADLDIRGVRLMPLHQSTGSETSIASLFHPGQSVEILAGKSSAGYVGLLHPARARELKLRSSLWIAELDWETLMGLSKSAAQPRTFKKWPEFPSIERDFALLVKRDVTADKLIQVAQKVGKPLLRTVKVFDVYRGSQVAAEMTSIAVRVVFNDESRSLQEAEADQASERILAAWKKEIGVELRS